MEAKQKAIKDHYIKAFIDSGMSEEEAEAKWNEIEPRVDKETGWMDFGYCCNGSSDVEDELFDLNIKYSLGDYENSDPYGEGNAYWRPKSLNGIETNRGWLKVEDGLPEEDGETKYWAGILENGKFIKQEVNISATRIINLKGYFTHFQPIKKPSKPLY